MIDNRFDLPLIVIIKPCEMSECGGCVVSLIQQVGQGKVALNQNLSLNKYLSNTLHRICVLPVSVWVYTNK